MNRCRGIFLDFCVFWGGGRLSPRSTNPRLGLGGFLLPASLCSVPHPRFVFGRLQKRYANLQQTPIFFVFKWPLKKSEAPRIPGMFYPQPLRLRDGCSWCLRRLDLPLLVEGGLLLAGVPLHVPLKHGPNMASLATATNYTPALTLRLSHAQSTPPQKRSRVTK